jgi:SLOG-like protein
MSDTPELLPKDALAAARVAVSVSPSADLARLGLLELHFRMAVGEIARAVLIAGGRLASGGHLDPDGYTAFLLGELERFGRKNRPLRVYLAWSEHRRLPLSELAAREKSLGLHGDVVYLSPDGAQVDARQDRGEEPAPVDEPARPRSLTSMRRYMLRETQARVLIGGRRTGFQGAMPGVLEEALLSVEANQPLYLAAGFGGVTLDSASAVGLDSSDWLARYRPAPEVDPETTRGLQQLRDVVGDRSWRALNNGLDGDENRQLAGSYRPSEIAALVCVGLGRVMLSQSGPES